MRRSDRHGAAILRNCCWLSHGFGPGDEAWFQQYTIVTAPRIPRYRAKSSGEVRWSLITRSRWWVTVLCAGEP